MKRARYWHLREDGQIECTLCPRHCRLKDGQRGVCYIRQRIGDELIQTAYGNACGLAIDPIEKKPLFHFLPGSRVLSFGTTGCNLRCAFCQNSSMSRGGKIPFTPAAPEQIARAARDQGCQSVAFTYNDPIIFLEYAVDTAIACHALGLKTVAVTNGWIEPEARKEFYAHMDAANVDLKAFTNRFYKDLCGATLQPVLDTLVYIKRQTHVWLECTTLLIPGWNDSPEEIDAMTRWVMKNLGPDVPWHFSAYYPTQEWSEAPVTPLGTLRRAKKTAETNGLEHVHLGNVHLAT